MTVHLMTNVLDQVLMNPLISTEIFFDDDDDDGDGSSFDLNDLFVPKNVVRNDEKNDCYAELNETETENENGLK